MALSTIKTEAQLIELLKSTDYYCSDDLSGSFVSFVAQHLSSDKAELIDVIEIIRIADDVIADFSIHECYGGVNATCGTELITEIIEFNKSENGLSYAVRCEEAA